MASVEEQLSEFFQNQSEIEGNLHQFHNNINKDYKLLEQQLGKLQNQKKEARRLQEKAASDQTQLKKLKDTSHKVDQLIDQWAPRTGRYFHTT